MKLRNTKKFRTIVITRKKIIAVLLVIFFAMILLLINFRTKRNVLFEQYTAADGFNNFLISSKIHGAPREKRGLKEIIRNITGIDIGKPETILYNNPMRFYEVKEYTDPAEVLYPQPKKAEESREAEQKKEPVEYNRASKGLELNNATQYTINTQELAKEALEYNIEEDEPQILIVHTHTTESFTDSQNKYSLSDTGRSTDEAKNVTAVGNAMAAALNEHGIPTIHDTTVHDYPEYNGSYDRCKATVISRLSEYPSIKIVLDIHRDGIVNADGTGVKVACDINGAKSAQCMLVVGSDSLLKHDKWRENLKLACKIQNKANQIYPGLMRAINLREERFNQQLSEGALIIEIGSNGNTLPEAVYAAKLMSNVIAQALK